MRKSLFWSASFFFALSCKVTQSPPPQLANTIEEKTIFAVVSKNELSDTLPKTQDSINISIHKVYRDTINVVAVGDIMMGTNYPSDKYLPYEDGAYLWKDVAPYLSQADITFGNLEGALLTGQGEPKTCKNPDVCYLFKTPEIYSFHFKDKGFDLLSLANNHANDFGKTGRLTTQRVLDSLDLKHAGSQEKPFTVLKLKGISVGLVAIAPNTGTLNLHDENRWLSYISHLDTITDFVIFSFHGGAEGAKYQSVTRKVEYYVGENRGNVYDIAHKAVDAGADLIVGHGPHVVRGIEIYKNRIICYSLGNFLTYGRFNLEGQNGLAPLLQIKTTSTGEFLEGKIVSFKQSKFLGPLYDSTHQVAKKIRELSNSDFPENKIDIDESGRIFYIDH